MKKSIVIFLVLANLVLLVFLLVPIFYEDEIKAKVSSTINQHLNANVYFDGFGLGIFRNFPKLTASLDHFGVVNREPFLGDTLLAADRLEVGIDFWSLLEGTYRVNGIRLVRPRVRVKVLPNGEANYHIVQPQPETAPDTASAAFAVSISEWVVEDGYLVYDDKSLPTRLEIKGLDHQGSGDFETQQFDMRLRLRADSLTAEYAGTNYLNKKRVEFDLLLDINLDESKFTFKENYTKINDFTFSFDGWLAMLASGGYDMDLEFAAPESDFKTLLSLVPGAYTAGFKDVQADGQLTFNGNVRGQYLDAPPKLPGFHLNLAVENASFQYPAVPTPVKNINVDMSVDNATGIIDQTVVDIRDFRLDLGPNPVSGKLKVKGLTDYQVNADIKAKVNLAELTKVLPMPGLTLQGLYDLRLLANGTYSERLKTIPKIDANMSLQNGYVKSADYPFPIEQISLTAQAKNETGRMADTRVELQRSSLLLEGKPFAISGSFQNLDDLEYKMAVNGELDLAKITKIYPLEGMTLTGNLKADVNTAGKLSDAQAQRYDKLPTSGTMQVSNFTYASPSLAQVVKITSAQVQFTPQKMMLENYQGFLGSSDVKLSGDISNYIAYVLQKDAKLVGKLNLASQNFNVNEWLAEEQPKSPTDTAKLTVVKVPENLDFTFNADLAKLKYDTYNLTNAQGIMTVRGGVLALNNFQFGFLGGTFMTRGTYDPRNLAHPLFDFGLSIKDLSIPGAYQNFNIVKAFAPVAQMATGLFSSEFKLSGELTQSLMPALGTLTGGGGVNILEAGLKKLEILDQISNFTGVANLKNPSGLRLNDFKFKADMVNGKLFIAPTDLRLGGYAANIAGSVSVDGAIDYILKLTVPKNQLANRLSQELDAYLGGKQSANPNVELNLSLGGFFNRPVVKLLKGGTEAAIRQEIANRVAEEKQAAKEIAKETAKTVVTDFLKDKLRPKTDSTTATTDSTRAQPTPKPQERLKDAANKFLDRFKKRTPPTPAPDTTTKPPVAKPDSVKGE
jgi:AsmA-like C-terminal region